ncbi:MULTISPECIES: hypothetical protein [unclassified Aureimonas]|uniref:hypothetical protein n=1 Tax=unclassified Aureimonas TaxID=2615206 RepID=UPI000782878F|nr:MULTISPECIES: hypothetical protein [unclassified Aureimonas]
MKLLLSVVTETLETRYGKLFTIWVSFGAFAFITISISYLFELWATPALFDCRAFSKNYAAFVDFTFARLLIANWCISAFFLAWTKAGRRFLAKIGEWAEDALAALFGAFIGVSLLSVIVNDDRAFLFMALFYSTEVLFIDLTIRYLIAPMFEKPSRLAFIWILASPIFSLMCLLDPVYYPWKSPTAPTPISECVVGQPNGAF